MTVITAICPYSIILASNKTKNKKTNIITCYNTCNFARVGNWSQDQTSKADTDRNISYFNRTQFFYFFAGIILLVFCRPSHSTE